jgi:hypothetical protein
LDIIKLINLVPYTFLNPVILLVYIFYCSDDGIFHSSKITSFYRIGGNSQRINLLVYLGFSVLASISYIAFKLIVLSPLTTEPISTLDIILVQPSLSWYIAYLISFITLRVFCSKNGMEMNVGGFIFFPFLLLGAFLLVVQHAVWLFAKVI